MPTRPAGTARLHFVPRLSMADRTQGTPLPTNGPPKTPNSKKSHKCGTCSLQFSQQEGQVMGGRQFQHPVCQGCLEVVVAGTSGSSVSQAVTGQGSTFPPMGTAQCSKTPGHGGTVCPGLACCHRAKKRACPAFPGLCSLLLVNTCWLPPAQLSFTPVSLQHRAPATAQAISTGEA